MKLSSLRPKNIIYRLRGGHLMAGAYSGAPAVTVNKYGDVERGAITAWLDKPENADYVSPPVPQADLDLIRTLDRVAFVLGGSLAITTGILIGAAVTA